MALVAFLFNMLLVRISASTSVVEKIMTALIVFGLCLIRDWGPVEENDDLQGG